MKISDDIRYALKRLKYGYSRLLSHFENAIRIGSNVLDIVVGIAAVVCLVALTISVGYDLGAHDRQLVQRVLRICQGLFFANILCQIFLHFKENARQSRIIKWIIDFFLLVSVVAWIYPHPDSPWIPAVSNIVYSNRFLYAALGAYAVVDICYSLSRLTSRRTNPSLIMAGSFLVFIILGSLVLMLPKCTYHGISYFDSLFISSSAVCITGLTSVDIPSTFTPLGILVITVLVQLGSLGIITFTSFFAMFFTGNTSIYNQLLLKDMIYSKSMNSLIPTLLYVLGFTLCVELIGAVWVFFTVPPTLGLSLEDKLIFSGFHAMSSFCNAGFSTLPGGLSNPLLLHSNQAIYIATSVLIFAGAIGFPILVNFKDILKHYARRLWYRLHRRRDKNAVLHIYDLNTKLVLYTTLSILVIGSVAFFFLEYDNTLAGMSTYDKIVQSVFNSLAPRSAGFASVNPANFLNVTLLLVMVQMVIGGASQSMAGGIKVNAFGAVLLNLRALAHGHQGTEAFGRTINRASIGRAYAVIVLAAIALVGYCVAIMLLEPELSARSAVFEVVSALFTVGSSLGATPLLGDISKVLLCTAMFLGRVGIISILCGVIRTTPDRSAHFPQDNVIIN